VWRGLILNILIIEDGAGLGWEGVYRQMGGALALMLALMND
jgi:hypothetical protein